MMETQLELTEKDLRSMKLHQRQKIINGANYIYITRVVGGWLYSFGQFGESTTFVPEPARPRRHLGPG